MAICRWKMPRKALLLGPGFSGYTRALKAVGCEIQIHELQEVKGFVPGEELLTDIETYKPEIFFRWGSGLQSGMAAVRRHSGSLWCGQSRAVGCGAYIYSIDFSGAPRTTGFPGASRRRRTPRFCAVRPAWGRASGCGRLPCRTRTLDRPRASAGVWPGCLPQRYWAAHRV